MTAMQAPSIDLAPALAPEPPLRYLPGQLICPGLFAWEQLGDGRRTECWLAWSQPLWSHVVAKIPHEDHLDDPRASRRLGEEARILRRLAHPAVQRLLEDEHRSPIPHLLLEYVEGPTLATLVDEEGPLPAGDVVRIGMQLAACLHYLHGRRLVHMDLKPGNVALRDGRAVLLDFDIARPVGHPAPPGRAHGTRAYMAPEQCMRAHADPRMDLFALGTVVYELATGRPAFDPGDAVPGCEYPQLLTAPARARVLHSALPEDVDIVIHALLERHPDLRPQTALETLRLLASALPDGEEAVWPDFIDSLLDGE